MEEDFGSLVLVLFHTRTSLALFREESTGIGCQYGYQYLNGL